MRKIFLVIILNLLVVKVASAKHKIVSTPVIDTTAYYMVSDYQMANTEADAQFLRLIIKVKPAMYRVEDFFMNGNKRLTATTTVNDKRFYDGLQGKYNEYYQNGNSKSVRKYVKGSLIEDSFDYYSNGKLCNIKNYDDYTVYLKEYSDTTGKILTQNGNGFWQSYSADLKTIYEEGQVVNGLRNGTWKEFEGDKVSTVNYNMGKIKVDSSVVPPPLNMSKEIDSPPSFKGGIDNFADYLSKAIKNQQYARDNNIIGRVVVSFIVEKDGSITDARITRSLEKYIDKEVLRNIKKAPSWHPATINGKAVRAGLSIPIAFGYTQSEY